MRPSAFLQGIAVSEWYRGQIAHVERVAAKPASYASLDRPLAPSVRRMLESVGVTRLYTHQADAIEAIRSGRHAIVATGTASGKTLCYNVPVLEAICGGAGHSLGDAPRALYIYPTKALAQDQLRALRQLTAQSEMPLVTGTYDGDTLPGLRARLRARAAILLTNPDMLSAGILPHHGTWHRFLSRLRFVVIDEAHVYRGIFGSHVGCLLRRLERLCVSYGGELQFILCSATIGNPEEHAQRLTGHPAVLVDDDGAPRGERHFVLWNPPYVDRAHGVRASVNSEASRLLAELVQHGLRSIAFVRARRVAELIALYTREALQSVDMRLAERIRAYRGGYLPEQRREIERRLFGGELLGVVATNALELGIDVGALDASVLVGYPGTVASLRQQAGRAVRGRRAALAFLLAYDNPLDQYLMRHPEALFRANPEHARMDPGNAHVLREHISCAAYEAPITEDEASRFGPGLSHLCAEMEADGVLKRGDTGWFYALDDYPAGRVNLRSSSGDRYLLVDETGRRKVIEEIDAATAFFRIYPGSVYLHHGETFLVSDLDLRSRVATARSVEVDYYTQTIERNNVHIVRSLDVRAFTGLELYYGIVRVREQVIGFRRKHRFSDAVLGEEPLDLPEQSFETQAVWYAIPDRMRERVASADLDFAGGLHAVEHASIAMLPLLAMCDRDDIGGLSSPCHPDTEEAQVFVHDAYPGGVGLSRVAFDRAPEHWRRTLEVVRECVCDNGCPSCIQSYKCGNNNEPLDKAAATMVLEWLHERGDELSICPPHLAAP